MDQTTLRRARWWILGIAILLVVGVALTVSRTDSGTSDQVDQNTTTSLAELQDEVRQATRPQLDGIPTTTLSP